MIVSMLEQPNSPVNEPIWNQSAFFFTQVNRQWLTKLAEWVKKDQYNIEVNIDKTFSLDVWSAKALDYQKGIHPRGKVVLTL